MDPLGAFAHEDPQWLLTSEALLLEAQAEHLVPIAPQELYARVIYFLPASCWRTAPLEGPHHSALATQLKARLDAAPAEFQPLRWQLDRIFKGLVWYIFDAIEDLDEHLEIDATADVSTISSELLKRSRGVLPPFLVRPARGTSDDFRRYLTLHNALGLLDLLLDLLQPEDVPIPELKTAAIINGVPRIPYQSSQIVAPPRGVKWRQSSAHLAQHLVHFRLSDSFETPPPATFSPPPDWYNPNNRELSSAWGGIDDLQKRQHPAANIGSLASRLDAYAQYTPVSPSVFPLFLSICDEPPVDAYIFSAQKV